MTLDEPVVTWYAYQSDKMAETIVTPVFLGEEFSDHEDTWFFIGKFDGTQLDAIQFSMQHSSFYIDNDVGVSR